MHSDPYTAIAEIPNQEVLMRLSFASPAAPKSGALVLLAYEDKPLGALAKAADEATGGAIKRAMAAVEMTGKIGQLADVTGADGLKARRIYVVGMGKVADLSDLKVREAAGAAALKLQAGKDKTATIQIDADGTSMDGAGIAANFAYGIRLKTYSFDQYKTKDKDGVVLGTVSVQCDGVAAARKAYKPLAAIGDGVTLARDLVNEPPNVLVPREFAKRAKALEKLGVTVEILGEKELKKLGMGALLGVGQGSAEESHLVVLQWNGAAKTKKPVAFVGKGVTFDTGGISLKPGQGMWDMKMDMGGAAAVIGTMHTLAARKAKVNAVGILALVENMPDGLAQRPADVVTSLSGQTIEVLNTDAEGRLILADALWYCQDRFKPQAMINLATLTGAIIVALGHEHAGIFSNNDDLATALVGAGQSSGDAAWRMPIGPSYNKLLKSSVADVANISRGGGAGSITAACFLERFVNDVPWAHIDIAGTAWRNDAHALGPAGATGYGVQILNQYVADHHG